MTLFFVEAPSSDRDGLSMFVRAEHPKHAFQLWRTSDYVVQMDAMLTDLKGDVTVWVVPDVDGMLGALDWPMAEMWTGRLADDFPLDTEGPA